MIKVITRFQIVFLTTLIVLGPWSLFSQELDSIQTEIRYYGTACFTIQRGGDVLLTDPFISNPSAAKLLFGKTETDKDYVDKYINPASFGKSKLVIAGHSHYDHLLDLPYLSKYLPDSTPIVSNQTAKHILSWYNLSQPIHIVSDTLGTETKEGMWVYSQDSTLRAMAFKSMHPPHMAGIRLMNKRYTKDLRSEPNLVGDWQGGKTLAFMVDWLMEGEITYRIFFSSSLAKRPFGLFPESMLEEHPIDDLFISSALLGDFDEAPKPILDLAKPKRVILMHWENFFRSKEKETKPLDKKELDTILSLIDKEYAGKFELILPQPLNYY